MLVELEESTACKKTPSCFLFFLSSNQTVRYIIELEIQKKTYQVWAALVMIPYTLACIQEEEVSGILNRVYQSRIQTVATSVMF